MYDLLLNSNLLALVTLGVDPIVAQSSNGLVTALRNFIGPIVMLVVGIAAISFLFQRQIMQFIIFMVIAIGVFALLYAPQILANLGTSFGSNNSAW